VNKIRSMNKKGESRLIIVLVGGCSIFGTRYLLEWVGLPFKPETWGQRVLFLTCLIGLAYTVHGIIEMLTCFMKKR